MLNPQQGQQFMPNHLPNGLSIYRGHRSDSLTI